MDSSKIEFYKSSVEYILKVQKQDGSIPWEENKKLDPWDHIEAAMGLSVAGKKEEAESAFLWLKANQLSDGSWYSEYLMSSPVTKRKETNFSAYIATGLWHYYLIFEDKNFDPSRLIVIENTAASSPAGYLGDLEITSAYVNMDAYINDNFRLAAGIRNESGEQMVNTYDVFKPVDSNIEKVIDEDYNLPSFTLTYLPDFDENLQIRFGYSETIARPTFRELSPTLFVDVDTDRVIAGSLYLENSEIENFDLRLEYYFGQNQFLTLGAFYKEIDKPI